eukprot:1455278-Rhodomonas_salina.1
MLTAGAVKRNQYLHLARYLSDLYPGHIVICQSDIIRVLSLYPQSKWVENCESLDFTSSQATKVQLDDVRACGLAGHALNNTARSRMEGLSISG